MYARQTEGNKVLFCGCMVGFFFSTEMLQYKFSFKLRNLICHFTFSPDIYVCSRVEVFVYVFHFPRSRVLDLALLSILIASVISSVMPFFICLYVNF